MGLLERIDSSVERLGQKFTRMLEDGPQPSQRQSFGDLLPTSQRQSFGDYLPGASQGPNWGAAIQRQGGGTNFGALIPQSSGSLFSRYLGGLGGSSSASPFNLSGYQMYEDATAARKAREAGQPKPGAAPSAAPTETGTSGTPGAGWGQPSTAQLDQELTGSPLAGKGATIAQLAAKYGVPVSVAMGILKQESSYGRNAANTYNYGGLTGGDPATGNRFRAFGSVDEGLDAVIGNMGTPLYRGKTIAQFMQTYAPSTDGNDTNAYINNILTLDHQWGGKSGWDTVVSTTPVAGPVALTPGTNQSGQWSFPVAGYQGKVELHWGESANAADIFAAAGTPVLSMGNGTVQDASWNELGGWTVTLKLDNGLLVYMAHMQQQPGVRAGQRVTTGTQLGQVGNTGNAKAGPAHLHIGIGRDIVSGSGPEGGSGTAWGTGPQENAYGLLNWLLSGGGAGGAQQRS